MKRILFGLLLLAQAPGQSFVSEAWALTGSAPAESAEFAANVQIRTEGVDERGDRVPAYCNATLLSAQVLVTAAHCVKDAQVIRDFSTQIDVGEYRYVKRPDGTVVRIGYALLFRETIGSKFHFSPDLARRIASQGLRATIGPDEDVAVITLATPLPVKEGFAFAQIIPLRDFRGILPSIPSYWPTVVTVNPFAEISTNDTKRLARLGSISWTSGYFKSTSGPRVEEGDSGSPLFVRVGKQWLLAGVVKGKARSLWGDWDVFTALNERMCQIAGQIPDQAMRALVCRN